MTTSHFYQKRILSLQKKYHRLARGKKNLLHLIEETEVAEAVYNSNAIENSTLTLKETEKILLEMELSRSMDLREVFEAKNLARVMAYLQKTPVEKTLSLDFICLLHRMLLGNIEDEIAGRFRQAGEYVRVGLHLAPAPEKIESGMRGILKKYQQNHQVFILDRIAEFHLQFEHLHPFNDGNGRIGRVLINLQLLQAGLPGIILRNKEKRHYYQALRGYDQNSDSKVMSKILCLALMESLHKRLAYLQHHDVIPLAAYAKQSKKSISTLLNAAKRQTIPAFRERGKWHIGSERNKINE